MKIFHFFKYNFLFSCLLMASAASTLAVKSQKNKVTKQDVAMASENDPAQKIVISNGISWTILLTMSSAVYWFAMWRDAVNQNNNWGSSARMKPAILCFQWFYRLFANMIGFDHRTWRVSKLLVTALVLVMPMALSLVYEELVSGETFYQFLSTYFPSLTAYMQNLFGYVNKEGAKSSRLLYFLAILASFSIGVFGFVRYVAFSFAYCSGVTMTACNILESFICGLLGVLIVPIAFYVPKLLIGIPLEMLIDLFWVDEQEAATDQKAVVA